MPRSREAYFTLLFTELLTRTHNKHMALFNFSKPSNNGSEGQEITLIINDETVSVPADEAKNMTIKEVFSKFAGNMVDVDRISRFINSGRIVAGTAKVEAGTIYSGVCSSESKGIYTY